MTDRQLRAVARGVMNGVLTSFAAVVIYLIIAGGKGDHFTFVALLSFAFGVARTVYARLEDDEE